MADDAQDIEVVSQKEAALRQQTGFTASGQTAPETQMVDMNTPAPATVAPRPPMPTAAPDPARPVSMDTTAPNSGMRVTEDEMNASMGATPSAVDQASKTPLPTDAPVPEVYHGAVGAAFRQFNVIGALYNRYIKNPDSLAPPKPGYDAFNDIHGYEDQAYRFSKSLSPEQTQVIKNRIDFENADKAVIARSGWSGVGVSLLAGTLDPITVTAMAVPGAEELGLSRVGAIVAGIATNVAAGEVQQAAISSMSETTKYTDNIGSRISSNALLAGVLGAWATRVPKDEFTAAAGRTASRLNGVEPAPFNAEGGQSFGAAGVPETSLEQESIARGGVVIARTLGKASPSLRVMTDSAVPEARRLTQQLVDVSGLTLEKNKQGIATPESVEARAKAQVDVTTAQLLQNFDAQYLAHKTAGGDMSRGDFSKAISQALRRGDVHDDPAVAQVAKQTRQVFDAHLASLKEVGALPEDFDLMGAQSYFPRVYDQHAVMNNRTDIESKLTDWFTRNPKTEEVRGPNTPKMEDTTEFYHGSPYVFSAFDHSKIGTGEGNQSFSRGIYGAESQTVGQDYGSTLTKPGHEPQLYKFKVKNTDLDKTLDLDKKIKSQPEVLKMLGFDPKEPRTIMKDTDSSLALEGEAPKQGGAGQIEVPNPHWKGVDPEWTGRELHDALLEGKTQHGVTPTKEGVADYLTSKGVTGARYLDAGSRTGDAATKTRNLVMYKNMEAEITHRNGERINQEAQATEKANAKAGPPAPVYRSPVEVKQDVYDTLDRIQGTVRGTADIGQGVKNPSSLKGRKLDVPDSVLEPYLSSDYEHVMTSYMHTMIPQIEMRKTFGTPDMTAQFEKISDAYHVKITAAGDDDALKAKLIKQHSDDIANLTVLRDSVLGQAGARGDSALQFVRASQVLRSLNYQRMLGGQTVSAIPDLGRLVTQYGLLNTGTRTAQLLSGFTGGLSRADAQRMGTALDGVLHTRQHTLEGIGDDMAGTGLQRVLQNSSNFFTKVSGIAAWDSMIRTLSSQLEQDALQRLVMKDNISSFGKARLAAHGIGEEDLPGIRAMWAEHGSNEFGLNRARTERWTDRDAAAKVESAVQRAGMSNAFYVGKGDMPGFAHNELGKIMVQFKGFAISSVHRLAIPLAQGIAHGDIHAANGLASMLGLGALTYYAKEIAAGRRPDLTPHNLAIEATQKSGVLTYVPDMIDPLMGAVHLPRFSKFQDLSPTETLGGPTAGTLDTLMKTASAFSSGDAKAADIHKLRQLVPYNNIFYLSRLVNMVEGKADDVFNVPGPRNGIGQPGQNALDYLNPAKDQPAQEVRPDKKHLLGNQAIPNHF